jgi:hypothetical protein
MLDSTDIVFGGVILAFFAYILIDSHIAAKKQEKQRKEKNEQRVKEGKLPIDYDNISVGGSVDSEAVDKWRKDLFRRMGGMAGI